MKNRYNLLKKIIPIAFFAILAVLFFWYFLFPNSANIVSFPGHMSGDTTGYFYPSKTFTIKTLSEGKIPLWNPNMFSGYPHYADPQSQIYYPLNLLLIPIYKLGLWNFYTFELFQFFHVFLGALFAYLLGKKILKDNILPYALGVIYGFSNIMLAHIAATTIIVPYAYIPLVFYAALHFLDKNTIPRLGFLSAVFFLLGTGGYPAILITAFLLAGILFIHRAIINKKPLLIASFIISCLLAGLALSIIILPAINLGKLSVGGDFGYNNPEANWQYSNYPPSFLLTFLFPDNPFWNAGSLYIGLMTFFLFCFSFYLFFKKKSEYPTIYLILSAVSLFIILGRGNFLYSLFYNFIPGFSSFRFPEIMSMFFILFIAILALWTIQKIMESTETDKEIKQKSFKFFVVCLSLYAIAIIAAYFFVYFGGHKESETIVEKLFYVLIFSGIGFFAHTAYSKNILNQNLFKIILVVILTTELLTINKPALSGPGSPLKKYENNNLISKLKELQQHDLYRLGGDANNLFGAGGGSVFNINTTFGHATRMNLKNYRLTGLESKYGMNEFESDESYKFLDDEKFYDLLNVKYFLSSKKDIRKNGYNLIDDYKDKTQNSELPPSDIYLYERETALPRFFFSSNWQRKDILNELTKTLREKQGVKSFVVFSGENKNAKDKNEQDNVVTKTVSRDSHAAFVGGEEKGNVYKVNIDNFNPSNEYFLNIHYTDPGIGGLDSYGAIYLGKNTHDAKKINSYDSLSLQEGLTKNNSGGVVSYNINKHLQSAGTYFVILKYEQGQSAFMPAGVSLTEKIYPKNEIKIIARAEDVSEIKTNTEEDGFIIFSEVYYPGWKAEIDGMPVEVKEIDGFLMGVYAPKGIHQIRFYFSPNDWKLSIILSLIGGATIILSMLSYFLKSKK